MNNNTFYHLEMQVYNKEQLINQYFYAYLRQEDIISIKQYLRASDRFPITQRQLKIIAELEFPSQEYPPPFFKQLYQIIQCIQENKLDQLGVIPKFPISPMDQDNKLSQVIYGNTQSSDYYYKLNLVQRDSVCWHRCNSQNILCDQCNQQIECSICHYEQTGHTSQQDQQLEPVSRHCSECQQLHFLYDSEYYTINHSRELIKACKICNESLKQGFFTFDGCHIYCVSQLDKSFLDVKLKELKYNTLKYTQILHVLDIMKTNLERLKPQNEQATYQMVQVKCTVCGGVSIYINNNDLKCFNIECFSNKDIKILNQRDITLVFLQKYFNSNTFRNDFTNKSSDEILSKMLQNIYASQLYQKIIQDFQCTEQHSETVQEKNQPDWNAWDEWDDGNSIFVTQNKQQQDDTALFSIKSNPISSYLFGGSNQALEIQNQEEQDKHNEQQDKNQENKEYLKSEDFVQMFKNQMDLKLKNLKNIIAQKQAAKQQQILNVSKESSSAQNSSMSINQPLSNNAVLNYPKKKRRAATESRSSSINSYFAADEAPSIASDSSGVDFDDL